MHVILRILAVLSLTVFGFGLFFALAFLNAPCGHWALPGVGLAILGYYGLLPAMMGSAVAVGFAAARRQWGWLAALLVAAGVDLAFFYSVALDSPPGVLVPVAALSRMFEQALSLGGCMSYQAIAIILVQLPAPLVLLGYTFPATWPRRDGWAPDPVDAWRG